MRKDLVLAMALAAVFALMAVAGVFLEWSPILIGLLIAVMVAADGYLVLGFIRQNKKTRDDPGSGRKSPPFP